MDFFGVDDDDTATPVTPSSNSINRNLFRDGLDLNSDAEEFPNLTSYQELLQSRSDGAYGHAGRVTDVHVTGSTSAGHHGVGSRQFRIPRAAGVGSSVGGGGAAASGARGAAASGARGVARSGGRVGRGVVRGGGPSGGRSSAGGGRAIASSGARGHGRGGMSPPLGNLPYDGYEGNMDSMGFSPTTGTYSPPNVDDSQKDTIDPFGTQITMGDEHFDKANWTDAQNNTTYCELCVEQIREGNRVNVHMTGRGFKIIVEKFYLSTGLRHNRIQLKNRWGQLKGLYNFWLWWLWCNKQTGLGRARTVVADEEWWKKHTKPRGPGSNKPPSSS
ncbi:hypothetical protein GQ55_4G289200 [Panicum hallii var. hallii]|uniref:Myb/SANT-like domain-containing protein n=1 Tax=Panicum hallii var. hallii TaxID=1504633 RepID=A0A2T7E191_9POAL|nr:hypothetical protein GQ55_4G289200 [Panicum hallii var. hallii]